MYYLVKYFDDPKTYLKKGNRINENPERFCSLSPSYKTKEELIEGENVLESPCNECGGIVSLNFVNWKTLKNFGVCIGCNFWLKILNTINDSNRFIINGESYYDDGYKDIKDKHHLGFGGDYYKIRKNDGSIVETNNLWYNGEIPSIFKDRIKDNAEFIKQYGNI